MQKTKTLIAVAAAVVLLPGLLAGCSGAPSSDSTDRASGSKGSGASLSSCMRDKGYDMPDPSSGGREMTLSAPDGVDTEQWSADFAKCAGESGAGDVQAAKPMGNPEQLQQIAKCIRENGFADYPDDQEGQMAYKPSDTDALADAESKCFEDVFGKDAMSGEGVSK
ncbi:hypothetical protein ACRQ4B_05300 [Curtobacterium sp. SP.BCo]|uniref:hypothetical protein n=1 Tax=Curtobacterium sp. SP.BCo TaxID=3435229 RepID=UPI003F73756B